MPLPTPQLDDRHFQDIVDQAKLIIPHYCREWTDHNVSDPGVTLIELFAWMTDMLLYRVNQVPDKNYITFLELLGMHLEEPRAATVPVSFYLSAAQPNEITIPIDTEIATVRTETEPPIIFTTERLLVIRPPVLLATFTRSTRQKAQWTRHDLKQARLADKRVPMFAPKPEAGDAFLLAFENDLSNHILALLMDCQIAGGAGVDPTKPPLVWQVWQGNIARWVACELEYDGTGGFNNKGKIILHVPQMVRGEFQGTNSYWLRCLVTGERDGSGAYRVSPMLRHLQVESRGGTVNTRHAITVQEEYLGTSDGTPGQIFKLRYTPVLALDPQREYLVVEPRGGTVQRWKEVEDFADSGPDDFHFTLDKLEGVVTLGPALLQPDGQIYRFGRVPDRGSGLVFKRYRYGGGVNGNVAQNTVRVLKTSMPYVAHVINRIAAVGGRDAQTLEDARLRAPKWLRSRSRAVTTDDYEYLASQVPGVARSCCLTPGAQPAVDRNAPRPGQILVIVLPQVDDPLAHSGSDQLALSAELRAEILAYLDARRLLGTTLEIRPPQYVSVQVQAILRVTIPNDVALVEMVQHQAEEALKRYLNPHLGGPRGEGWPFGRALNRSELYGLLQRIEQVEFVEELNMYASSLEGKQQAAPQQMIPIPPYGLICSGQHQVKVQ